MRHHNNIVLALIGLLSLVALLVIWPRDPGKYLGGLPLPGSPGLRIGIPGGPSLERDGFSPHEAWEMVRERHLLLPPPGKPPTSHTLDRANSGPSDLFHQMLAAGARGQRQFPIPEK